MTYRERRERRAEQRREWAESREAKSAAAFEKAREVADGIPFGQPILVGHHSEGRARRDQQRIVSGMIAGHENARVAERHEQAAGEIDRQLRTSIYSDDPDAVEALTVRIAGLEAERDRIKAFNASCRKGSPDESLLDASQRADLASVRAHTPYSLGKNGSFPAYGLTNLSGNINRQKKRLAELQAPERARRITARFDSTCDECGEPITKGTEILYYRRSKRAIHATHREAA